MIIIIIIIIVIIIVIIITVREFQSLQNSMLIPDMSHSQYS